MVFLFIESILPWVLDHPEIGWVLVIAYLFYELRTEGGRIYKLDKKVTSAIVVIRAQSRLHEKMDEEAVDDYLVENGMEPGDFIEREHPEEETVFDGQPNDDLIRNDAEDFDVDEVIGDEESGGQDFTHSE